MRRGYLRPQVPWDVRGLFTALRADGEGDAAPLGAWMGAGFRSLRSSLEASGLDPAAADDVASEVAVRALSAHRRGIVIRDECAWASGVAAHVRADAARLQRRTRSHPPLSLSLSRGGFPDSFEVTSDDSGAIERRLAEAIFVLPTPYREAMAFQRVERLTRRGVLALLGRWLGLSPEGCRHVLRKANGMLRAALVGEDPRRLWPRRYPPFLHIPRAWLTLPPGDLRLPQ